MPVECYKQMSAIKIGLKHFDPGADPNYSIGGAQIFHPLGCISGGQTRARSARELRANPEPRAKPET